VSAVTAAEIFVDTKVVSSHLKGEGRPGTRCDYVV